VTQEARRRKLQEAMAGVKLLLVLDGERLSLLCDIASVAACVWADHMPRVASPDLWEAEHGLDVGINGIDESNGSKVCRGAWARVAIDQFRRLALQTFKKHGAPANIFSTNKFTGLTQNLGQL
jgi:hypothetical protein